MHVDSFYIRFDSCYMRFDLICMRCLYVYMCFMHLCAYSPPIPYPPYPLRAQTPAPAKAQAPSTPIFPPGVRVLNWSQDSLCLV